MRHETAKRYAHQALPYLVRRAQQHQTTYYSQLSTRIGLNEQGIGLGDMLDFIREEVCVPRGLPHLNTIVVRTKTQRPPDEVIEESGMHSGETHQAAFERLKGEVFAYDSWDDLLAELNATS